MTYTSAVTRSRSTVCRKRPAHGDPRDPARRQELGLTAPAEGTAGPVEEGDHGEVLVSRDAERSELRGERASVRGPELLEQALAPGLAEAAHRALAGELDGPGLEAGEGPEALLGAGRRGQREERDEQCDQPSGVVAHGEFPFASHRRGSALRRPYESLKNA